MSKNTPKGKAPVVMSTPTNVAARLTITAYTDKPPNVECTGDLIVAMKLLGNGLLILSNVMEQKNQAKKEVEDRERKLMGPRKL
jgi:hypothetical protein